MGHADRHSAGNFCPNIECDLSAGFSIDGYRGTAGECAIEIRQAQLELPFEAPAEPHVSQQDMQMAHHRVVNRLGDSTA